MGRKDSLLTGAVQAVNGSGGSHKTRYNHIKEAERFVRALRDLGYGVQRWTNITNKHVGAVVDRWREEGKAVSTVKEYLSGVRGVLKHFGNDRIAPKNAAFGLENRVYVSNRDKALPQAVYERVVEALKDSDNINDNRIAAQLQLERELGLRTEEAFKLNPGRAVLSDGRVYVSDGTKGGRDRMINEISEKARSALSYARSVSSGGNTMAVDKTERQWSGLYYRTLRNHGISKEKAGASGHGLRHAYAQERYRKLTGFTPPVKHESREDFRANAQKAAGDAWRQLDRDARLILKSELGHGPDREDVVSQYLGSV